MKTNNLIYAMLLCLLTAGACKKSSSTDDQPQPQPPVVKKEQVIEISTTYGNMYMWLYKQTPLHRDNFIKLASQGFFNNTTFHRIIPGFVIQGGDPNSKDNIPGNDGQGGPGYDVPIELNDSLTHVRGAVGSASNGAGAPSSGSQFYVTIKPQPSLNKKYAVFGFIMKGMEVADSIVKQPRDGNDRPTTDIKMQVRVIEKTLAEIKTEYNYVP